MSSQTEGNPSLTEIAREICLREGIKFHSLGANQIRGLTYYWCSDCSRTYPLSYLTIARRKKVCTQCNGSVKLYATSNKFGKIRRMIFRQFRNQNSDVT
jgi:DNA-directed RNA polymerase subunit RPC12/RpoP